MLLLAFAGLLPACGPGQAVEPIGGYMVLGGEVVTDLPVEFEPAIAAVTAGLADAGFGPPPARPGVSPARPATPGDATPGDDDTPPPATGDPFRVRRRSHEDWLIYAGAPGDALCVIRVRGLTGGATATRVAIRVGSGERDPSLRLLRAVRVRLSAQAAQQRAHRPDGDPPPADGAL